MRVLLSSTKRYREKKYERLGFQREGIQRDGYYYGHMYHDFVMMSMLETEFQEKQKATRR